MRKKPSLIQELSILYTFSLIYDQTRTGTTVKTDSDFFFCSFILTRWWYSNKKCIQMSPIGDGTRGCVPPSPKKPPSSLLIYLFRHLHSCSALIFAHSSPVAGSWCWWRWPDICSSRAHRPRTLSHWSTWWGRAGVCSAPTRSTDMGSGAPPAGEAQSVRTSKPGMHLATWTELWC